MSIDHPEYAEALTAVELDEGPPERSRGGLSRLQGDSAKQMVVAIAEEALELLRRIQEAHKGWEDTANAMVEVAADLSSGKILENRTLAGDMKVLEDFLQSRKGGATGLAVLEISDGPERAYEQVGYCLKELLKCLSDQGRLNAQVPLAYLLLAEREMYRTGHRDWVYTVTVPVANVFDKMGIEYTGAKLLQHHAARLEGMYVKVSESVGRIDSSINAHKEAYTIEASTQEPIEYWRERHDACLTSYRWWFGITVFLGIAAALFVIIYVLLPSVYEATAGVGRQDGTVEQQFDAKAEPGAKATQTESQVEEAKAVPEGTAPSKWSRSTPWAIGSALFVSTITLLLLRLTSRLAFSSLHIANDAKEREIMMQAYLALLRSEKLREGGQIDLVLSSLFRPGTTGLIKEDSVPPGMFDVVVKAATAGKG